MNLDLTLTSSGRPDLLDTTLFGLTKKLLPKANFGLVYVNIDPVPPTTLQENNQCIDVVNKYFPGATIISAKEPSFGVALSNLWKLVSANKSNKKFFLHFEDDWESLRRVNLRSVSLMLNRFNNTKQVILRQEVKSIKRSLNRYQYKSLKVNGIKIDMPVFSTSPSFVNKVFAGKIAELIDPTIHPEKQINDMTNHNITNFIRNYKCRKYIWLNRKPVIEDLGVEWYFKKGFDRVYINGIPTYIKMRS